MFKVVRSNEIYQTFSSRGRPKLAQKYFVNIIVLLILFYGNVFHYYIHDVIIIKLTYDSSKIAELVCLNENERKDLTV